MATKKEVYVFGFLRAIGVLTIILTALLIAKDYYVGETPMRVVFWLVMIPLMVLIIYLAPGLWRNMCPLATTHLFYFNLFHKYRLEFFGKEINILEGRLGKVHEILKRNGMLISAALFWIIVPARLWLFYDSNFATIFILAFIFLSAFIMGFIFPVKSGWCTSICPVFAVEKTYSINPAFHIRNTRCDYKPVNQDTFLPCSGCSFNCLDVVGPEKTYLMENSTEVYYETLNRFIRSLFISTMPGFLAAYFFFTRGVEEIVPSFLVPLFDLRDTLFTTGIANIIKIYLVHALFMLGSYIFYKTIKWSFKRKFPELDIEKPNEKYSLYKRRLDLIFVTMSINIFWAGFSYGIFNIFLLGLLNFSESIFFYLNIVSVLIVFSVSLYGIKKGWNETFANNKASWW